MKLQIAINVLSIIMFALLLTIIGGTIAQISDLSEQVKELEDRQNQIITVMGEL